MQRVPLALAIVVTGAKLIAVLAGHATFAVPDPFRWLMFADPLPLGAAVRLAGLMFDQRRIWPTRDEELTGELLLLLFTALQWYFLGVLLARVGRAVRAHSVEPSAPKR